GNVNLVSSIAVSGYQGPFVFDSNFPLIGDIGVNSYDANTIYITDGTRLYITKDHATNGDWVAITPNGISQISSIAVSPDDRDWAWVTSSAPIGTNRPLVMGTKDAGHTWTDLTGNLKALLDPIAGRGAPVWKIVEDPRTGYLYVGTD